MFNKKLIGLAIASAFSANAFAANLNDGTGILELATEALPADYAGWVADADAIDIDFEAGFSLTAGTSKYVRIDLTDATFETDLAAEPLDLTGDGSIDTQSISQGGLEGDDFVIIEVTALLGIVQTDVFGLNVDELIINTDGESSATYSLYDSASDAVAETGALVTTSGTISEYVSVAGGDLMTNVDDLTATIASEFLNFDDSTTNAISITEGYLGTATQDNYLSVSTAYTPSIVDGTLTLVDSSDVLFGASTDVVITGDFSFGTWTLQDNAACDGSTTDFAPVALTEDADGGMTDAVTIADTNYGFGHYLCVELDGAEMALKSGYVATFTGVSEVEVEGTFGNIIYDTTSVSVPYITTYSDYNQRVYLINDSAIEVDYSTSYQTEAGVTATAKDASTGTIPANTVLSLKASDMVELTGKTRTAAIIELESIAENVRVVTQNINLSDGATDTTVLYDGTNAQITLSNP